MNAVLTMYASVSFTPTHLVLHSDPITGVIPSFEPRFLLHSNKLGSFFAFCMFPSRSLDFEA